MHELNQKSRNKLLKSVKEMYDKKVNSKERTENDFRRNKVL